jgi:ribose transport system ATP-binding protein
VQLTAHEGEILGITGLVASGKEELAEILSGGKGRHSGEVEVDGKVVKLVSRLGAVKAGLGYLSPDRRGEALILERDAVDNVTLASLRRYCRAAVIRKRQRRLATNSWMDRLGVRGPGIKANLRLYSGGNQQKISVAKWLDAHSRVLVMVEPTTGLDVGAKVDVYRLLRDLADDGVTIVLVSSDLEEVAGMSHRILVLRNGEVAAEFPNGMTGIAEILYEAVVGSRTVDGGRA